jgi:hypothetical protein|nr:MAG TPA: hypothetical protein [Caudoviricetes sp.]
MNLGCFWGIGDCILGKTQNCGYALKPHSKGISSQTHNLNFFPKTQKENITMSWGTAVYSVKGKVLYSAWLRQEAPTPW